MATRPSSSMGNPSIQNEQQLLMSNDNLIAMDFECNICTRTFPTKEFLTKHLEPNKKKCTLCCKRFRYTSNLVNHERVHTGEKPYTCDVCCKSFSQSGNLRTHMRIHSGDMPYTCYVCNRQFNQISNLTTHKCIHNVKKPFACNKCQESFTQYNQLIRHQEKH